MTEVIPYGGRGRQPLPGEAGYRDPFEEQPAGYHAAALPGDRDTWMIGGQLYLVWQVPVDADGDGQFDETLPIAFFAYPDELRRAGGSLMPTHTLTPEEWDSLGGLEMGSILDLRNTETHPFQYFVDETLRQGRLFPHLLDPEIMAVTAAAWLMGRAVEQTDLMRTKWWQTHSQSERDWLTNATADPAAARQLIDDHRIQVLRLLEQSGVSNAPTDLVNLLADSWTRGEWSDTYLAYQVEGLADPSRRATLDEAVTNFLTTGQISLDTTMSRRDTVRGLVNKWLGPTFGAWTDQQINDWAGRLRNDPDAEQRLGEMLAGQRMALFPTYTDPTATYQDIAAPWKSVVQQTWGEIPDESDPFFTQIVQANNLGTAQKMLRSEGLARKNKLVGTSALRDLYDSMGGQVVRIE